MYLYKVGSVLIECVITAICVCWSSAYLFVCHLVLAFWPQNIMLTYHFNKIKNLSSQTT